MVGKSTGSSYGTINKNGPDDSSLVTPIGRNPALLKQMQVDVANPEGNAPTQTGANTAPPAAYLSTGSPDMPANRNKEGLSLGNTTETPTDQVKQAHAQDLLGEALRGHLKPEDVTKAKWEALSPEDQTRLRAIFESQGKKLPEFTNEDDDATPDDNKRHWWLPFARHRWRCCGGTCISYPLGHPISSEKSDRHARAINKKIYQAPPD